MYLSWQRDRAKLDAFSINVQRYSQNHAQNWIFGPPYGGIRGNICALSEIFKKEKPCSRVSLRECQFYSYNSELAFLSHPFLGEGLGVTYASRLFSKAVGQFKRKFQVEVDIAHQHLLVPEN